ncbi:VWA domain-containing protein [Acetobacteraceae bacterium KSS8]|uniref:VWA domain-containing protein n=1 Tax=Endosaccharibacter trunci TaxID=2812733 RepID=A0ABT1W3M7_9PROT|nr:VWA domain-containing protein [Acetobacteraceae bacterium KSS8]
MSRLLSGADSIGFSPLLPVFLLWSLGALCLVAIATALVRRASGAIWRGTGFALLLAWLSGPTLLQQDWRPLGQTLLLLVDRSASMRIGDRQAVADQAAERIRQEAAALPGITVRTVPVSGGNGQDQSGGTHLVDAIRRAAESVPASGTGTGTGTGTGGGRIAAIVAITDGQAHDVPAQIPSPFPSGNPDTPLHVLIPAAHEQTDRRLRVLQAPPFAIVGQNATIRVQLDDLGPTPQGAQATLTIRRNGDAPEQRPITAGVPQDITVPVTAPGPLFLSLHASSLPGEVSDLNNDAVLRIDGVRDHLRVLLVSGTPNQGERVWRRLLKADPAVELVHFTILRPPYKDDSTPLSELALIAFPIRELFQDKIGSFDLIILDGFENRGILPMAYLSNIADFVRDGGGLLVTAGPEFIGPGTLQDTPLGDILPVRVPEQGGLTEQRFQPMPTPLGRRHPVTADLPQEPPADPKPGAADRGWGDWYRALRADKDTLAPGTEVLLSGPGDTPLLLLNHVGKGRVALLLSDQLWLWSRGEDGGGPQAELLRRLAHWLMKEPELEEERLSASIENGTLSVQRHSVSGTASPSAEIIAPDGSKHTLALKPGRNGTETGNMPAIMPGIWEARIGEAQAFAAASPGDPVEMADLRATAGPLHPLIEATGGSIHWLGDRFDPSRVPALRLVGRGGAASGPGWIGLRDHGAHAVTGERAHPLLPAALVLPLALFCFLFGWWRESGRRRG